MLPVPKREQEQKAKKARSCTTAKNLRDNVQNRETFRRAASVLQLCHRRDILCTSYRIDRRREERTLPDISNQLVFSTRNRTHNCKQLPRCLRAASDIAEKKNNLLATTAGRALCPLPAVCGLSEFWSVATPQFH